MIDSAAKDSSKHSAELKAIQRDQRVVCEKQQNVLNRIMMVCLENHLVNGGSRHVHKTADWTNISVTDTHDRLFNWYIFLLFKLVTAVISLVLSC